MGWTVDDIIAEAARLPLRDAPYVIWRQKSTFERLQGRRWEPRDMSAAEARDIDAGNRRSRTTPVIWRPPTAMPAIMLRFA
jgi:hypothetical protein